jgi:hypothetical protein
VKANVSVAAFSCIGALLVSLAPFCTPTLIETFKDVVVLQMEVSSNTSIAIIAIFLFLAQRLATHEIPNLIRDVPVLHHFNADLRAFLHYVPNLIKQMSDLGIDFHRALLRSLIIACGKDPNSHIVDSLVLLLNRYPEALMNDLMDFMAAPNRKQVLLALGSQILRTKTLSVFLSRDQKATIFELAKVHLFNDELGASFIEHAVSVIFSLKNSTDGDLNAAATPPGPHAIQTACQTITNSADCEVRRRAAA